MRAERLPVTLEGLELWRCCVGHGNNRMYLLLGWKFYNIQPLNMFYMHVFREYIFFRGQVLTIDAKQKTESKALQWYTSWDYTIHISSHHRPLTPSTHSLTGWEESHTYTCAAKVLHCFEWRIEPSGVAMTAELSGWEPGRNSLTSWFLLPIELCKT